MTEQPKDKPARQSYEELIEETVDSLGAPAVGKGQAQPPERRLTLPTGNPMTERPEDDPFRAIVANAETANGRVQELVRNSRWMVALSAVAALAGVASLVVTIRNQRRR